MHKVMEKGRPVFETHSEGETDSFGAVAGRLAVRGLFVALCGELGSGKTVFARGMARGLGCRGRVTSPTFQLVREYQGSDLRLFHFDFYRLGSEGEAVDLDIEYCLEQGVVAAEWSDRFPGLEWPDTITVRLEWAGETDRRIEIAAAEGAGTGVLDGMLREID